MSESKPTFYAGLKARAKRLGVKLLEITVIVLAYFVTLLLRLFLGLMLLLSGIATFLAAIILGSRRTATWMEIVAKILRKYPI